MATRLLIVDDDAELTRLLTELLGQEGFDVDSHSRGGDASARATGGDYALIILDVMLPEVNGFEILRQIRRASSVPVILLTARGDDVDRIVGLEIGADDYVPKPFNPRELVARIRAVLRRMDPRAIPADRRTLSVDDVVIDSASRTVLRKGEQIEITTIEFDILWVLLQSAGQAVSREAIAEKVLSRPFEPADRSVDVHVGKLRRKLGNRPGGEERIRSIRSVGYIYTLPGGKR